MADHTSAAVVSLSKIHEMKPPKGGRRTYLLIDNTDANSVRFDFGVAPTDISGILLAAGTRYERDSGVPQSTIFIRGSQAADQLVQTAQGYGE